MTVSVDWRTCELTPDLYKNMKSHKFALMFVESYTCKAANAHVA